MKILLNAKQKNKLTEILNPMDINIYKKMMELTTHSNMSKIKTAKDENKISSAKSAFMEIQLEKELVLKTQDKRLLLYKKISNAEAREDGVYSIEIPEAVIEELTFIKIRSKDSQTVEFIEKLLKHIESNIKYSNRKMVDIVNRKWTAKDSNGKEINTEMYLPGGEI